MQAILDTNRNGARDRRLRRPGACLDGHRHGALSALSRRDYRKPVVIAGFEPLDVIQAILMLVRQINEGRGEIENQYRRAVRREGNRKAQARSAEIFELRESFEWRGLGTIPHSALQLREAYARFDAEQRFAIVTSRRATIRPANAARSCAA